MIKIMCLRVRLDGKYSNEHIIWFIGDQTASGIQPAPAVSQVLRPMGHDEGKNAIDKPDV